MSYQNQKLVFNIVSVLIICLVCVFAKIRAAGSDPQGTLLVSQAIVQHGTIKLDDYKDILGNYTYKIQQKNEHFYYYFPLGTSVFSLPFVAVSNAFGVDMVKYEPYLQGVIALFISVANFFLLSSIASLYVGQARGGYIALAFWLGTSYASTTATALWSHDLAVFFAGAAIFLLLRVKFKHAAGSSVLIGFSLFSAYFCRPTLALLVPVYLVAMAFINWRLATKAALAVALFLAGFILFSIHEFHQILPDYYLPQRLAGGHFWVALYGNLLSPARGLLIYSPFLLLPIAWILFGKRVFQQYATESILLIWPAIHLIVISRFPHWWAGYSFGARLMTDVLPAFFVLLVCYLQHQGDKRLHRVAFALLIMFAVWVNTVQGLFNRSAAEWNGRPSIDQFPEYLFDWRYPQFLSTKERLNQRMIKHDIMMNKRIQQSKELTAKASENDRLKLEERRVAEANVYSQQLKLHPLIFLQDHDFVSPGLYFIGWSGAEQSFRWSSGHHSEILFYLAPGGAMPSSLSITASALDAQKFRLLLNEHLLGDFEVDSSVQTLKINADAGYFLDSAINVLHFEFPGAKTPPSDDPRVLALAFRKISLDH